VLREDVVPRIAQNPRRFHSSPRAASLLALITIATLSALSAGGCRSVNSDRPVIFNPDEGGTMATAMGLFFDLPVDDRLNKDVGDDMDWRYIIVAEPGTLSVSLNVDNPYMMGVWYIRDGMGRVMYTERLDPRKGYYEALNMPVEPGRYFFHFEAMRGSSIYTVGAKFINRERNIADVAIAQNNRPTQTINGAGVDETKVVVVNDNIVEKPKGKPKPKAKPVEAVVAERPVRVYTGKLQVATGENPTDFNATFKMDGSLSGFNLKASNVKTRVMAGASEKQLKGITLSLSTIECIDDGCATTLHSDKPVITKGMGNSSIILQVEVYPGAEPVVAPEPTPTPDTPPATPGGLLDPQTTPLPDPPLGGPVTPGVPQPSTDPAPGATQPSTDPAPGATQPSTDPAPGGPIRPNLDGAEPPLPGSEGAPG
jgi:hypothetical protein